MSTNRIVKYNEELFKIPSGTKKRSNNKPPIKIKPTTTKTIKRKILDELRNTQQQQFKTLSDKPPSHPDSKFETDFKNSVDYMQTFIDNHKKETTAKLNSTIKEKKQYPVPAYGCLKNGNLPTYRNVHGTTMKNNDRTMVQNADVTSYPPIQIDDDVIHIDNLAEYNTNAVQTNAVQTNALQTNALQTNALQTNMSPMNVVDTNAVQTNAVQTNMSPMNAVDTTVKNSITERIKSPSEIMLKEKTKQKSKVKPPMDKHKRRFLRRTYHVGKDKYKPKVGVLLPNKTIRKRVTTSSYLLKQTPIEEIRKFLLKKGFIKVGSSAPNDVLRKMYESIQMIDGEINNHNPENLLHNFFNHK